MVDKRIRIILDSKGAKRNADELNQSVRGVGDSADRSQFSVNKLAAAIAAVISVQKIAQFADAFARVQNQLLRTVDSTQELAQSTQQLLDVANQTRQGIEPTVELYTSLTVSTKDLAISQGELVDVTKTINNLFLESGKGASETAGAIRQLGQALESGALRGDEFNSVAEGAPGILRAIQQETGLTRGELRKLAEDGQITAELIVRSLQNYSQEAQNAADKTQVTLAQAFTVADNNLTNFIGQIDDATGASSAFAGAIIDLTNYIGSPDFISGVLQAFNTAKLTINSVSDSVGDLGNEFDLLGDVGSGVADLLGDAFKNFLPNIKAVVEIVTVELISGFDKLRVGATTLFKVLSNPFDEAELRAAMQEYETQMQIIADVREQTIADSLRERETIINTAKESSKAYAEQAAARKIARDSAPETLAAPVKSLGSVSSKVTETSSREIESAQAVTKSLEQELALRRQIADIYRSNELDADATFYQQQLAQIQIREAEELALAQAKATEESAQREQRLAATLESDKISAEARAALKAEFDAQELTATQILEQEKTRILEEGKNAREELDRIERENRLKFMFDACQAGIALLQAFGSKSSKTQKLLAQTSIAVDTAQGIAAGVKLGWPAGIPAVAWAIANGKNAMDRLKAAGGSGGGAVSAPAMSTGMANQNSFGNLVNSDSNNAFQQKRVIEVRGINKDTIINGQTLIDIFEGDDNVVVSLTGAQADAQRRGVI